MQLLSGGLISQFCMEYLNNHKIGAWQEEATAFGVLSSTAGCKKDAAILIPSGSIHAQYSTNGECSL